MTEYCVGLDYAIPKNPEYGHLFTGKENIYFNMVDKYFRDHPKNYKQMVDIIDGNSKISLRILDWYITKYTKKYKINYTLNENGEKTIFFVHIKYKAQLQSYKKQYFDPFRRKKKFIYKLNDLPVETTLGQLNFFMWAFQSKIIEQVDNQFQYILNLMNKNNKDTKEKKANKLTEKEVTRLKAKMDVDESNIDISLEFN